MATYKIKGQRYLRKYTEQGTSPVYAASVQAQKIVDTLCEVPWTRTGVDSAQMTYHTEEIVDEDRKITGLEMNVDIRDSFDAALFCAGHRGGMHRAYANAAVYRYTMPDDAIGKTLVSLAARVTSDPYNSEGVRLHVFTNSTGEIPMNCHVLRGESAAGELIEDGSTAAAVAKRTEKIVGKETYWYPTTETCNLQPQTFNLQKYLFVLVALESYSTVRGNWLEGCSFIANSVEIETSAAIDGLSETDLNDLRGQSEGESPSEITLRIVANADLKGKLWLQAVSYETKRILKKWSFDCEFFYGQNEKIVTVPNASGDQELLAHHGGIFFEAWVGGEQYDAKDLYGCSNLNGISVPHTIVTDEAGKNKIEIGEPVALSNGVFEIELTPTSTVFSRINLTDAGSDRKIAWGIDSGDVEEKDIVKDFNADLVDNRISGGRFTHVRVVPYLVAGTLDTTKFHELVKYVPNRVVAEFDVNTDTHPYITEADFLKDGQFDIDWDGFIDNIAGISAVREAVGTVTAVKYRMVLGKDGPIGRGSNDDTTTVVRAFSTLIERRYEKDHTHPTALSLVGGDRQTTTSPTFLWRLDEPTTINLLNQNYPEYGYLASAYLFGCSYTAFQIEVANADSGEKIYDSGVIRAPARDAQGRFAWKMPLGTANQTALSKLFAQSGNWKWRVAMYNARFKPTFFDRTNGWSDWSTFSTSL